AAGRCTRGRRHEGDRRDEAVGARGRRRRAHRPLPRAQAGGAGGSAGGGGRNREPGRESRRLRGRRGGQGRRPGSCGVRSLLQSCKGLTGGASVTFSATAGGRRTSTWA